MDGMTLPSGPLLLACGTGLFTGSVLWVWLATKFTEDIRIRAVRWVAQWLVFATGLVFLGGGCAAVVEALMSSGTKTVDIDVTTVTIPPREDPAVPFPPAGPSQATTTTVP